ncbi:MAG: hypothetical protein P8Z37_17425, partial [Acidobacteriota bacterium]
MVINLYREYRDADKREILGSITESQLDSLLDNLEEELDEDEVYLLNAGTLEFLKEQKVDEELIRTLEKALPDKSD